MWSIIRDKDIQVLSSLNNPAIQKAFNRSGNKNATIIEMKNINHLMQECKTGLSNEYSEIEESFNEEVAEIIPVFRQTNLIIACQKMSSSRLSDKALQNI